jgi:hypothetical protein
MEVDIDTLKREHPDAFEKAYWRWVETAGAYDTLDYVVEQFVEDMEEQGATVGVQSREPAVFYSVGYCQSDYASFCGSISLATWMRNNGYALTHLPLVLDVENYGGVAYVGAHNHGWSYISQIEYHPGNAAPCGVFADMPQAEWDQMIEEMWASEDWEKLLNEWVSDTCRELYTQLRDEHEYQTSKEQFIEHSSCNETLFEIEDEDETHC